MITLSEEGYTQHKEKKR